MGFKRFSLLLSLRIAGVMLCLTLVTWLLLLPGYQITALVLLGMLGGLIWETLNFIRKTNAELTRFLDALRYNEFTQRFDYSSYGSGFEELGKAFTDILKNFQNQRESQEKTLRYLKALVEQVPVPLISLQTDGQLKQWNNSARRLFGSSEVSRLDDLKRFGASLPLQLQQLQPGDRELVSFEADGMSHQLSLSATQISIVGQQEKLISLQDIRTELDIAQLQAWQDLVRVLTHEIMNSITPVASLAGTAADLVDDIQQKPELSEDVKNDLQDVQDAVQTLSRRSNSLMNFVSSYRRLTRLPQPTLAKVNVVSLFKQVQTIAAQDWAEKGIELVVSITPDDLYLNADTGMLEQVLINLLQNAEQALSGRANPRVNLNAFLNRRGHGVIEVSDNGPGIEQDIIDKVFVPFFTTKREGSGVGLALTRQVMIAHNGNAKVENLAGGGAKFTLTF